MRYILRIYNKKLYPKADSILFEWLIERVETTKFASDSNVCSAKSTSFEISWSVISVTCN